MTKKLLTPSQKQRAMIMWLEEKQNIEKVMSRFNCSLRSMRYWKKRWSGTADSLKRDTSKPRKNHPNAHTKKERKQIEKIIRKNPEISYAELLGELRIKFSYSRTYLGLRRFINKNLKHIIPKQDYTKHIAKPYNTPPMLGIKMQMDIKFIPKLCYIGNDPENEYYQFTMIDETTRERFIYPYRDKSSYSARDFISRSLAYFGYLPYFMQTDNDYAFVHPKGTGHGKEHLVTALTRKLNIQHVLIRPYTPRHNGKVERSHRTDNTRFYSKLQFKSYHELKIKMEKWCITYNNTPSSTLRNKFGKRTWQSPIQKREELLEQLHENKNNFKIEFEAKHKPKKLEARNKTDLPSTKKLKKVIIRCIRFLEEKPVDGEIKYSLTKNVTLDKRVKQPLVNPYPKLRIIQAA